MAATAGPRKTISIYDYPEHLNPFREDDNHNKIRFWTIGRKLNRSNSITFSGIKELKNSWAFRSFMKKGKKGQQQQQENKPADQTNGETSPIVFRRALQYSSMSNASPGARSTVGSPERYIYGGSVTPLPRSRFQERLRSTSQQEVNSLSATPRLARSELGSRLSVASTNPFDEDEPTPPVRAARRKKKRAPAPPLPPAPTPQVLTAEVQMSSSKTELHISENKDKLPEPDADLDDTNYVVELKIVEDDDLKKSREDNSSNAIDVDKIETNKIKTTIETTDKRQSSEITNVQNELEHGTKEEPIKKSDSEDDILNKVAFPKVDIVTYRRNSSLNEDDIRLRRGNLEDFPALSNKRSKSLTNALNDSYLVYDINLNESKPDIDTNGNQEPQKVVCKLYNDVSRKQSVDSTEKEFMEIDKATRELEREINKLNSALNEDDVVTGNRLSVSNIKRRFESNDVGSPNPIPKPRRSHYGEPTAQINGNISS